MQEKAIKNKKIEKNLKIFIVVDFGCKSTNKILYINELK
jgi:hypothetical protein